MKVVILFKMKLKNWMIERYLIKIKYNYRFCVRPGYLAPTYKRLWYSSYQAFDVIAFSVRQMKLGFCLTFTYDYQRIENT